MLFLEDFPWLEDGAAVAETAKATTRAREVNEGILTERYLEKRY
jgi:hypothetical protein